MTFGLKNAEATYQKAIQKCLESQIGKNIKAYIDDIVVKTTVEDKLIINLAETFASLRIYRWKLNPEKCVFGVPSGKLLGFMVSHQGRRHPQDELTYQEEGRHEAYRDDGGPGSFYQQAWRERPSLLHAHEKV
jgi:hypothetical protein